MAIANITGNILTDSGIATSSLLPLTGGTLTGALSITSAATYALDVTGTGRFTGLLSANAGIQAQYGRIDGRMFTTSDANYGDMLSTTGTLVMSFDATGQQGYITSRNYSTSTDKPLNYGASKHIFNGGNVGIGTSSPGALLAVQGASGADGFGFFMGGAGSTLGGIKLGNGGSTYGSLYFDNATNDVLLLQQYSSGSLRFGTNSAERMRITSGGNVEIANGTLTTSAGSGTSYCARLQTIYSFPYVENYLDAVAGVSYQGRFHFRTNAGNGAFVTNIRIESSGAVFLPAYGNGTMSISGGQITTSSDKNLKNDDGGIDNALDKVLNLNPRYFYWKEESGIETTERQLGFYAQDVKEALGIEVANDNGNDKWGIYDRGLIAMLTKAIQELSAKVSALENKS